MRAAAVQMSCVPGKRSANLEKAGVLVDRAVQQGVRWVVLPELFGTGYHTEAFDEDMAEAIPGGPVSTWMQEQARRHRLFITGGISEALPEGGRADAVITVRPDGTIAHRYRKCHLWSSERLRFQAGTTLAGLCELEDGWNAGVQICYEVGFPEGSRQCALQGAQVLCYSSAFGLARTYAWEIAVRARALENGCYVIAADLWGSEGDHASFAGKSCIVSPRGTVLAQVDEGDGLAIAELELSEVKLRRSEIPYLHDLNRDLAMQAWHCLDLKTTAENTKKEA